MTNYRLLILKPFAMKLPGIILMATLWLFLASCGGSRPVNKFYHKHKKGRDVSNFTIPGWLIWFGAGLAYNSVRTPEVKSGLRLAKKVKGLRVMVSEGSYKIPHDEIVRLKKSLNADAFEDLIIVRDETMQFSFMIKEKKHKIKSMFFMVEEDGEFMMMHIRSNFKMEDLREFLEAWKEKIGIEKPMKKPRPQA